MNIPRLIGASALLLSIGAVACDDDDDPVGPGTPSSLTSTLAGANERPVVVSNGTGTATFTANAARTELAYSIRVNTITGNITNCHIHIGASNVTSSVIINLCEGGLAGPITTLTEIASGTIIQGSNVTAIDVSPVSIPTLLRMMVAGDVYVNVHTSTVPSGEIRGSVFTTP